MRSFYRAACATALLITAPALVLGDDEVLRLPSVMEPEETELVSYCAEPACDCPDDGAACECGDECGCGHRHGPTVEEVQNLKGWRDALALIGAIAIRPCTGAVIVLVIAWQTGLYALGLAAVTAMALGTGAFTAMVALASVSAREASFSVLSGGDGRLAFVAPTLQIVAGGLVLVFGAGLLQASLA